MLVKLYVAVVQTNTHKNPATQTLYAPTMRELQEKSLNWIQDSFRELSEYSKNNSYSFIIDDNSLEFQKIIQEMHKELLDGGRDCTFSVLSMSEVSLQVALTGEIIEIEED